MQVTANIYVASFRFKFLLLNNIFYSYRKIKRRGWRKKFSLSDYRFKSETPDYEYICDACIINQDYTHFHFMAGTWRTLLHVSYIYIVLTWLIHFIVFLTVITNSEWTSKWMTNTRERTITSFEKIYSDRYALFWDYTFVLDKEKVRRKEIKFINIFINTDFYIISDCIKI